MLKIKILVATIVTIVGVNMPTSRLGQLDINPGDSWRLHCTKGADLQINNTNTPSNAIVECGPVPQP